MKKNKTMRLATLLLALTLITSCFVGGTFAKYTTSADVEASARVAYWGFTQTDDITFNLFEPNDDGVLNKGSGLLAPGSEGSAAFKFVYTDYKTTATAPEVDYTFNITVTATGAEGDTADTDLLDANPNFKWTLQASTADKATEYDRFEDLKTAIEALDGNKTEDKYEAGTLPEAFYGTGDNSEDAIEYTIGWKWQFETSGDGMDSQDAADTAMGNATDLDDLKINIKITATQVT